MNNEETVSVLKETNEVVETSETKERSKLYSMLSLCKRAGQLVSGEANCEKAIKSKRAKMVFLSCEASKNTTKKFTNSSSYYKVPLYVMDISKERFGKIIGEEQRSVIAIIGGDFIEQLKIYAKDIEISGGGPIV